MRAMATWFCDAYASCQKGGVENANGRLRRWLPRHIDIDRLSDAEIQDIVITANLSRENVSASRRHFRRSSKSLAKTLKSASLEPVALRPRIHDPRGPHGGNPRVHRGGSAHPEFKPCPHAIVLQRGTRAGGRARSCREAGCDHRRRGR